MVSAIEHNEPRTVSLEESNHRLGIARTRGYEMAQSGTYPVRVFRVGNRWRVSANALARLIEGDDDHDGQDAV